MYNVRAVAYCKKMLPAFVYFIRWRYWNCREEKSDYALLIAYTRYVLSVAKGINTRFSNIHCLHAHTEIPNYSWTIIIANWINVVLS